MKYKLLGKSGLRVSELSLGTMTFGEEWGWGADIGTSAAIYDAYRKAGGNFIDTANRYTEGTSERFVGEFIKEDREKIVLATKYTLYEELGDPNMAGNHRKNLKQSVEHSLKRLDTDYIDLLWLHMWDFTTPVQEVMRSLDDLVSSGKVLYIGISDTPAWVVARCNTLAELRGWTEFVGLQIEYSLIARTPERDLLPMAREMDIAVTPWGVLGGGALTGKYNKQNSDPKRLTEGNPRLSPHNLNIAQTVVDIAEEIGQTPGQVAINWARQKHQQIIPIIGARKIPQIQDSLKCLEFTLTDQHMEKLDTVSAIELGFPHDFLQIERVQELVYAGMYGSIINHRKR